MKKLPIPILASLLIIISFISFSCGGETPVVESEFGNIYFKFDHTVDGAIVEMDTTKYTNALGQSYGITEIQYFISAVSLHNIDGSYLSIYKGKTQHYIDSDLPATYQWRVTDDIPPGTYDSVIFRFGFTDDENIPFMFPDDPEASMYWPNVLGGGYHYIKLNGTTYRNDTFTWFNYHSGRGQIRDNSNNITGFVDCSFNVNLPLNLTINKNETHVIPIQMEIQNWFKTPNDFDIHYYSLTMEVLHALLMIKENGHDVFSSGTTYER